MDINKAIEDFKAWYDSNKGFQNLKLYDFIVDDGGILYDGYDISPELKGYYIEFAASNPKDLDNKHICTFGPYGIRGRIVAPEFDDLDCSEEFIIRDDSPFMDTGYPGITLLDDHHAMVVYYIEDPAFPNARGIEGNIIEF